MTASDILRLLNQVPPRYELVVTQGDTTHRIHDLSYSHSPAQVTLRLVPIAPETASESETNTEDAAALMFAENITLRDQNAELLPELQELRKAEPCQNCPTLPEPEATIAELNGEVPVDHITEVAPLPEPDVAPASASSVAFNALNDEMLAKNDATMTMVVTAAMSGKTHMITAEMAAGLVAADPKQAAGRRIRKPKSAPFATGDSRPADGARAPFGTA